MKACPETADDPIECKTTPTVTSCTLPEDDRYGSKYVFEYCFPIYDTLSPTVKDSWTTLSDKFKDSKSGKGLMDIYDARWVILGGTVLAVLITFGYIKFMDWCAYWLAWISVVLLEAFFVLCGVGAW